MAPTDTAVRVTLIGAGTIGISFAALYLKYSQATVSIYDPRADLHDHIRSILPGYLDTDDAAYAVDSLIARERLRISSSLEEACSGAAIVQEQGPENLAFKVSIWKQVIDLVSPETHLWSSTSGIPASKQAAELPETCKSRLLVCHPFNPPHLMPLIELVGSPETKPEEIEYAKSFFDALGSGHKPVVVKKEVPGFVGNRLAFVLLREACHLVSEGVVSVEDLDTIVEASVGPRWAVTGPLKSYHYGGGTKGLGAFFQNLSGTIEDIWQDAGRESFKCSSFMPGETDSLAMGTQQETGWAEKVVEQTTEAYGLPTTSDFAKRDEALRKLLQARGT
ncbi:hypothetical protein PMZ80_006826 [Knufia obscura]|uniref:L-gulonate 3-dehydrogenase n=2 Tax=Knufia TaxID=430999 RepID=A0AAN8IRQ6_9EURO|nr:hypothetical protein PMZ80_006826 [Knufia obscura]KAK5957367.1 hypothetical protein OHC33_001740 [Knufia fluminis]